MWIKRAALLLAAVLLLLVLVLQVQKVPSLLQYAFIPPSFDKAAEKTGGEGQTPDDTDQVKDSPLQAFLKTWDGLLEGQADAVRSALLIAHSPNSQLATSTGGSAAGELQALYGQLHTHQEEVLISGRRLYQEELDSGAASAVLDEGLAIALFRQSDSIGLHFTMDGVDFTVVGVVRHSRGLGERAAYGLRVPMLALKDKTSYEMMHADVQVLGGSGSRTGLAKALSTWQGSGRSHDLVKEKYRATLPIRVLLCLLAISLSILGLRLARLLAQRLMQNLRDHLQKHYAHQQIHIITLHALGVLLLFALPLALLLFSLVQLISPVYVFPEWVPAVLVEPREISKTFWNLRQSASALVEVRTSWSLLLQALGGYIATLSLFCGMMLIPALGFLGRKIQALKKRWTPA